MTKLGISIAVASVLAVSTLVDAQVCPAAAALNLHRRPSVKVTLPGTAIQQGTWTTIRAVAKDQTKNGDKPIKNEDVYFYAKLNGCPKVYLGSAKTNKNGVATLPWQAPPIPKSTASYWFCTIYAECAGDIDTFSVKVYR